MPKEYSLNSEVAKDAARDIVFFLHPSIYMMQTYKLKGKGSVDLGNVEEVKFIDLEPIS